MGSPTADDVRRAEDAEWAWAQARLASRMGCRSRREPWEGPPRPKDRPRGWLPRRSITRGENAPNDGPSRIEAGARAATKEDRMTEQPAARRPSTLFPGQFVSEPTYPAVRAMSIARQIADGLRDVSSAVMICGSLRRGKQQVHDVDLVVFPRTEDRPPEHLDLFQRLVPTNLVPPRLREWEAAGKIAVRAQGEKLVHFVAVQTRIPVDLYFATPETWARLVLIRTGSKEHNIRLCAAAREKGMILHADGSGLEKEDGTRVPITSEEQVFELLGLPFVPPEERG